MAEAVNTTPVIEAVDAQVPTLAAQEQRQEERAWAAVQDDPSDRLHRPNASRTSSQREKSANLQTPSTSRSRTSSTPANPQATKPAPPMTSPPVSTRPEASTGRSPARVKAGEVLVPLRLRRPVVSGRSQAAQAIASESAGSAGRRNTLNLPWPTHGDLGMEQDLDPRADRQARHPQHIGNMLKAREQNVSGDDPAMED